MGWSQACKLKFRLRELTSCLCSAAAWAVCFEGSVAGVNATETGNVVSQPTLEFTPLGITHVSGSLQPHSLSHTLRTREHHISPKSMHLCPAGKLRSSSIRK